MLNNKSLFLGQNLMAHPDRRRAPGTAQYHEVLARPGLRRLPGGYGCLADKNDPGWRETIKLWQELRIWLDRNYPEAAIVSEWSSPPASIGAGFHMDFLLHFGSAAYSSLFRKPYSSNTGNDKYGFSFFDRSGHGNIMEFLDGYFSQYQETRDKGLICLITGNHDINPPWPSIGIPMILNCATCSC